MAGGIVLASVTISADILPYISVKASFLKFNVQYVQNNIDEIINFFSKHKIVDLIETFLFFVQNLLRAESHKQMGAFSQN